jgi:uncharacterized protein YdeI (YjbR/CyaY-like superfamily)
VAVPKNDRPLLELASADEWREWLAQNHAISQGAWVTLAKKGGSVPAPSYEQAVEEALCWGWIDTTARRLDADRYLGLFTPRRPGGTWARSNKERVARLIASGRMQPAGQAVIDAAKASGTWTLLDEIEALVIPGDLATAFSETPGADAGFAALADYQKQMALYWIASAKRPETRTKRIAATAEAATEGRAPV